MSPRRLIAAWALCLVPMLAVVILLLLGALQ